MRYIQIRYVPEGQDPSLTIETDDLVAKVIDNTGLLLESSDESLPYMGRYGTNSPLPSAITWVTTGSEPFYDKTEGRNIVVPLASWFNLQGVNLQGIDNDPVDERAWAGVARGWPMHLEARGRGAIMTLEEMPSTGFGYTIEFQPAEPDGIDLSLRFTFGRKPEAVPTKFNATWPCYVNAYDDVRFNYPRRGVGNSLEWTSLGDKPEMIIGEAVGYRHRQKVFHADDQVIPLGFGRIGRYLLILMFDDPSVNFFVVNAGGHLHTSAVQNPAWDISWSVEDFPLNEPIGFNGRLIYAPLEDGDQVMGRYRQWVEEIR